MAAERAQGEPRGAAPPDAAGLAAIRQFITQVRGKTARRPSTTPLPAQPLGELCEVTRVDDVTGRFLAAATAAGCQTTRLAAADWPGGLLDWLHHQRIRTVLIEPDSTSALTPARAEQLSSALREHGLSPTTKRDDATLFDVHAAVTGVRVAVAETGTIVCASGTQTARGSSLISPVHIAIVETAQIVPDLFDVFDALGSGELPANVNFITGPSKTADIEGVLVTGVHGPGIVHVVLLD